MLTKRVALFAAGDLLLLLSGPACHRQHRAHGKYDRTHHLISAKAARCLHSKQLQLSRQPKTKPNDAFKMLGRFEHCGKGKTYRRGSQRYGGC
jgi:hypothetical protein